MGVEVQPEDVEIYATRQVCQYSNVNLDDLLDSGNNMEGYFEYDAEWEDEDVQGVEYTIQVDGVVGQDFHNKRMNEFTDRVKRLENQIKSMRKESEEE